MVARDTCIRVAVVTVVAAVGVWFAYPHVAQRIAESGGLLDFYVRKTSEAFQQIEFGWAVVQYGLAISALGLGFEILVLGWSHSSLRRLVRMEDRSSINDIFYWLLAVLNLSGIVRFILTLGAISVVLFAMSKLELDIRLIDRIETPILQYVVAFLAMDFMGYFQHRLAHSWDWWWELHKIHHSAEKFNMITFYRTHVLEALPRAIIYGLAISVVGDWNTFIFYSVILELVSMLVHSEIQYKWGWIEKYVLVSPRNHKVHHSVDPRHHDKNFGFTLIIWDRMFGTWYEPRDGETIEIGLKNNPFNRSNPVSDLLLAYRNCLAALFRIGRPATTRTVSMPKETT